MWQERLSEFVTLLVVVNPVGALPTFLHTAGHFDVATQRRIALRAVLVAAAVLLFFMVVGGFLLEKIGVSLRAFQIAGGIVLFVLALESVRGQSHVPAGAHGAPEPAALAVYPIAIPKIAGPATMLAVVLLTDDTRFDFTQLWMSALVLLLVLAATFVVLMAAGPLSRLLGETGTSVVGRVMGMILAALAVTMVLSAVASWLGLPRP
jgi:multiple antibiotic resistance protein